MIGLRGVRGTYSCDPADDANGCTATLAAGEASLLAQTTHGHSSLTILKPGLRER